MSDIKLGSEIVCHFTGKRFIAAAQGITVNYARDSLDNYYSDRGVYLSTLDDMIRKDQFLGYIIGNKITGWKGDLLGTVLHKWESYNGFCGKLTHVRMRDIFGQLWHGKANLERGDAIIFTKTKGSVLHTRMKMKIYNTGGFCFQYDDKDYSPLELKEHKDNIHYSYGDLMFCEVQFYKSVLKTNDSYYPTFDFLIKGMFEQLESVQA